MLMAYLRNEIAPAREENWEDWHGGANQGNPLLGYPVLQIVSPLEV